jgi:bifunctional N-acetylglucosamine-1-phosphate-uridyltransferase/glucosamine-1-phosphate-acetyltransferase GlmU-like protein
VGANAVVARTVGRWAEIGDHAQVGPYAHLGEGSVVDKGARTGPFYAAEGGET